MGTTALKILTVGAAAGSIRDLFAKIKAIDAKHGKFDFVLCIGDFFGQPHSGEENTETDDQTNQLLAGEIEAPLECYIMQGQYPLPDSVIAKFSSTGGELCKNVFLMSKSAIVTTAQGLRIGCLAGIYNNEIYSSAEAAPGFLSPFFSSQTVDRLLSNSLNKSSSGSKQNYQSLAAIQSSTSDSQLLDILVTNSWPSLIHEFSSSPVSTEGLLLISSKPLDDIIQRLKPRYHFATGGGEPAMFWERQPFVWSDAEGRVSRFVSLGAFGGLPTEGKKQRWFYAFSISPTSDGSTSRPSNATKNPFSESIPRPSKRVYEDEAENFIFGAINHPGKRVRTEGVPGKPPPGYRCKRCESTEHFINECPERAKPPEGYVCRICNEPGHFVRDCPTKHAVGDTGGKKPKPGYVCRACASENHYLDDCPVANQGGPSSHGEHGRGGRRGPPKEIGPEECWFCLSNPSLAKHLIVAIGSECYVTLPKGQIIPTQSTADHVDVPGGGHVLIVPITHNPTYNTIPSDLAPPIIDETDQYKTALRALYAKHGCTAVFFEVARLSAKGGHAHVQAVPLPVKLKEEVEGAFLKEGQAMGIDFEEDADAALQAVAGGRGGYFRVDLPDGRKLVHLMKEFVPFSIQFGRQALVSLLNMPNRLDWKACMLSDEEDRADAEAFKAAFNPFNPVG